jgi:alcohol dehydrogenase
MVLVKINAVSFNYKDAETIEGLWIHHKKVDLPQAIVPCSDAAGEVFFAGKNITRWKKGDRVLSLPIPDYKTGKITPEMLRNGISSAGKGLTEFSIEFEC